MIDSFCNMAVMSHHSYIPKLHVYYNALNQNFELKIIDYENNCKTVLFCGLFGSFRCM